MGRRHFNPFIFAGDMMVANMQIGTVLWHRLSAPQSDAETSRMVSEKIAAASRGVFEAQKAALRLSHDMMFGRVSAGQAVADIGAAAAKPARTTLNANAKRLGKRGPRK